MVENKSLHISHKTESRQNLVRVHRQRRLHGREIIIDGSSYYHNNYIILFSSSYNTNDMVQLLFTIHESDFSMI